MTQRAISLPFSFNSSGGVDYTEDEVKIWQDRVAITLLTKLKERVMRPTFGSGLAGVIHENLNTAIVLARQEIEIAFSKWLPALTLVSVKGTVDPLEPDMLNIEVVFKYGNYENETSIQLKTAILSRAGEVIMEVTNG